MDEKMVTSFDNFYVPGRAIIHGWDSFKKVIINTRSTLATFCIHVYPLMNAYVFFEKFIIN